ncbi:MAG: GGDEF domain-containing protein [Ancalomicrobiaceae bacterium]|nr:GGDEF domain-containing protein [Ancalomicrobiaceae bacterium]
MPSNDIEKTPRRAAKLSPGQQLTAFARLVADHDGDWDTAAALKAVMKASPAATLVCRAGDRTGSLEHVEVMLANRSAERLFGAPDGLAGCNAIDLVALPYCRAMAEAATTATLSGETMTLALAIAADPSEAEHDVVLVPFDGGLVVAVHSLAALQGAFDDLADRDEDLARANATIERQAHTMAAMVEEINAARRQHEEEVAERRQLEAELLRLAETDGMTGLFNRRAFLRVVRAEVARSSRYGHPPTMLYLDLDKFKSINDTYGHNVGDIVIKTAASRIVSTLRAGVDRVGRLGGDEFAVLLPETPLAGAMVAAERIRKRIAEEPIDAGEHMISATSSIGAAAWVPDVEAKRAPTEEEIEDWLSRADGALYEAKRRGRNGAYGAESPAPAGQHGDAAATAPADRSALAAPAAQAAVPGKDA